MYLGKAFPMVLFSL